MPHPRTITPHSPITPSTRRLPASHAVQPVLIASHKHTFAGPIHHVLLLSSAPSPTSPFHHTNMSTTQLPHLPVSTRDFAIETSLALNTVRRVPPSPPKQHKPLPPRPPRPEEEFAEEGFAARQVTPPLPVRSPRRGVDSPEPFAERGGRDGVPERSQHQTSTAPGQICGHGYAHGHAQNAAQPIALQTMHQLPTSFYAPKLAVSECAAEPVRRASTLDCKSWRTTWQRTRLALRVIVFLLLLVDVSMSTAMWENYRINKILAILVRVSHLHPPLYHTPL